MKNKKGLLILTGILSVIGAVGAAVGIKKIKSQIAEDEILIREEDLVAAENAECACDCGDDCACADEAEVADEAPQGGCGTGCCCAGDNRVYVAEEPTENIADIEDLKDLGVCDEIIEEIKEELDK